LKNGSNQCQNPPSHRLTEVNTARVNDSTAAAESAAESKVHLTGDAAAQVNDPTAAESAAESKVHLTGDAAARVNDSIATAESKLVSARAAKEVNAT
jgi:hypothetical protein